MSVAEELQLLPMLACYVTGLAGYAAGLWLIARYGNPIDWFFEWARRRRS